LNPESRALAPSVSPVQTTTGYETSSEGVTFSTPPMKQALEITGPIAVKLWVSSDTADADIFVVLRVFESRAGASPAAGSPTAAAGEDVCATDKEVVFIGSNDPRTPVGLGWLRASHRKLDSEQSRPYRPIHTHDEEWPLTPGEPVELDIEIWPTSIVVPPGYRLALTVRGKDYEYDGTDAGVANAAYPMKGVGPFTHTNPKDRPPEIFGGTNTLHFAQGRMPYVLLPIIPAK
jgi:predicted acyl esterase